MRPEQDLLHFTDADMAAIEAYYVMAYAILDKLMSIDRIGNRKDSAEKADADGKAPRARKPPNQSSALRPFFKPRVGKLEREALPLVARGFTVATTAALLNRPRGAIARVLKAQRTKA